MTTSRSRGTPSVGSGRILVALAALGCMVVVASAFMPPMVIEPRATMIALRPIEWELPNFEGLVGDLEPPEVRDRSWDVSWVQGLGGAAAIVALVLLLVWIVRRWVLSGRRPRPVATASPHGEVVAGNEPQLAPVADGVTVALRHLDGETTTDDAVIAAWLAVEGAAADAGVTRKPSDTPTEFTLTILARLDADPASARGLLGLYHRARFAAAPLSERERQQARRYLQRLARDWGQP